LTVAALLLRFEPRTGLSHVLVSEIKCNLSIFAAVFWSYRIFFSGRELGFYLD
jgi:hypothetical protein